MGQSANWTFLFHIVTKPEIVNPIGCIMREFKWIFFMTVATPRKTRTRKTAARKVTTPVKAPKRVTAKVRKVSKPAPLKSVRRPSASKLITPQRYLNDIKARWAIHNYEIQELLKDFSKGVDFVRPYHDQVVKLLAKWAQGVNPLFFLPVLVFKRVRFPLQANPKPSLILKWQLTTLLRLTLLTTSKTARMAVRF